MSKLRSALLVVSAFIVLGISERSSAAELDYENCAGYFWAESQCVISQFKPRASFESLQSHQSFDLMQAV
jgi:hypothetical protein